MLTAFEIRAVREVRAEYWNQLTLDALIAPYVKDYKPHPIPALLRE